MNYKFISVLMLLFAFVSCHSTITKKALHSEKTNVVNNEEESEKIDMHYAIEESEKIDKTLAESNTSPTYFENENGFLIEKVTVENKEQYKRVFNFEFEIEQYCFPEVRNLYEKNSIDEKYVTLEVKEVVRSSVLLANNDSECWLYVETNKGRKGWIAIHNQDPYKNGNWANIGLIEINGKKVVLRKYTYMFTVSRHKPAYDSPSIYGKILWHSERTDDNPQINLKSICVTNDTYQGKYDEEHWVKVIDSYGRIGWFPGDELNIERGGYKYLSPENYIKMSIYEP